MNESLQHLQRAVALADATMTFALVVCACFLGAFIGLSVVHWFFNRD